MPKYDHLSLIKHNAKVLHRASSVHASKTKLTVFQNQYAKAGGFKDFHELRKVAVKNPADSRVMMMAFGASDLSEIIYEDSIYRELVPIVEQEMSSELAELNTVGCDINQLDVISVNYNEDIGMATIEAEITISGESYDDAQIAGDSFNFMVEIRLLRRNNCWLLEDLEVKGA